MLKGVDGGVLAEDIIAYRGVHHGFEHARSGAGEGVGDEVDHGVE